MNYTPPSSGANLHSPGPIGDETPDTGAFTTLGVSGTANLGGTVFAEGHLIYDETDAFRIFRGSGITLSSNLVLRWTPGTAGETADLVLLRSAPGTLALRDGTNPQKFEIDNTWTDADNFEAGVFRWDSNVLRIGAIAAGTGTLQPINLLGSALQINGTSGATATLTAITSITVTNGIVTSITGT